MLQGTVQTAMSHVTCLQSQQQLQLAQSCSVIAERCLEQLRLYLSPEHNERFTSSDRRRQNNNEHVSISKLMTSLTQKYLQISCKKFN